MKKSSWVKLGLLIAVIAGVGWGLKAMGFELSQVSPERIREYVLGFGVWAPVVYLVAYGQPIVPLPARAS